MDKKERIKSSAYHLFIDGAFELASVNQIIKKAGIAKGTYYLYYETKEEVYLEILSDFYQDWFRHIYSVIENGTDLPGFIGEVTKSFTKDKKFLELLCRATTILEKNISKDFILEYKEKLQTEVSKASELIAKTFGMTECEVAHKLSLTYACIIGVYQSSKTPSCLGKVHLKKFPDLCLNFEKELCFLVKKVWDLE